MKRVVAILVVIAFAAFLAFTFRPRPRKTPELSFWYWHAPYALSDKDVADLRAMGVTQMFVRAGTFTSDGKNLLLRFPQNYGKGSESFAAHLVFNFDGGVVSHFGKYDLARMTDDVAKRVKVQWDRARAAGLAIRGIQFDLDCPTRLLPRYAQLIAGLRKRLPRTQISVTGLLSWLGTPGVRELSGELDFMVPQAYEGRTGMTLDRMAPISDPELLRKVIPGAQKLLCPYYIGLPTYGHTLLYDDKGRLTGPYRGLSVGEATRHPSFQIQRAYPSDRKGQPATKETSLGEEMLFLKAIRHAPSGEGLGYTLAYNVPAPAMVAKMLQVAREARGPDCLGFVLYRFPEPEDSLNISLDALTAVVGGKTPAPELKFSVEATSNNFVAVERGLKPGMDVFVTARNIGPAASFIAEDAVEFEVSFGESEIDDARPRDMASAVKIDSHTVRFLRTSIAVGEAVQIGPIRLLSNEAKTCTIRWRVRDPGGFETLSGIREMPLRRSL